MTAPTGPDPRTDANGCPDQPHHGVDCPGDACRYAADDPRTDAAVDMRCPECRNYPDTPGHFYGCGDAA